MDVDVGRTFVVAVRAGTDLMDTTVGVTLVLDNVCVDVRVEVK